MPPLRVAFLVDDLKVSQYVYNLVDHVKNDSRFAAPILLMEFRENKNNVSKFEKILSVFRDKGLVGFIETLIFHILYLLIIRIELPKTRLAYPNYKTSKELKGDVLQVHKFKGLWSKSKLFLRFPDDEIEKIRNLNLDVIIRCGNGILKGEILNSSKFGILSFHHGDNRKNRGGPSGFWEVLNDEPSSGFVIQRLNEELGGGDVIFRGNIMTSNTWTTNNAALLEKSNVFFMKILNNLADMRLLPKFEDVTLHHNKLYKIDRNPIILLSYLNKILFPLIFKVVRERILGEEVQQWSIAFTRFDRFKKSLFRYVEINNPKSRFLADPFVFSHREKSVIFAEDFFYSDNKGRISAISIEDDNPRFLGIILEEDFHLSYPFVFDDNGTIYMIPETSKSKQIRLYRCEEFPLKWVFVKSLMDDVSAADTMVVKRNGYWFMLTNICTANIGDHGSELHIFYSKDLLSHDWLPIESGNPVIFDSLRARNGGMFEIDGNIYRVNQVHGKAHYGKGFEINKITELTTKQYTEIKMDSIEPNFKKGAVSTHHFNSDRKYSVVDFMRIVKRRNV